VTAVVAGMRGGLGRTLLTAFMLLAIVPLSVVSYLAVRRVQNDVRQSTLDNLDRIVLLTEAQLRSWLEARRRLFVYQTAEPAFLEAIRAQEWAQACQLLASVQANGRDTVLLALKDPHSLETLCALPDGGSIDAVLMLPIAVPVLGQDLTEAALFLAYPNRHVLARAIRPDELLGDDRVLLVDPVGTVLNLTSEAVDRSPANPETSWAIQSVLDGKTGNGLYDDITGAPVVGSFRWLPDLGVSLIVEQPRETVLAREDELAAMLIGSTLGVALLTTALGAVVTRRLTRPIVQLTTTAVKIANGDLEQTVEVNRRDEIGILAQAFNIMTSELRSLYQGLEQKVAERTSQLTIANRQLRYQAMQLTLSAEVARIATSILDLDLLLDRVTELVLDSYAQVYSVDAVAVLLQDESGTWSDVKASSRVDGRRTAEWTVDAGDGRLALAIESGVAQLQERPSSTQISIPLHIGSRTIGVLDLHCSNPSAVSQQDLSVLQTLGDQISVAIENARIYTAEREQVERLRRLEDLRLASLGVGSRELATELNTIIGFSRLLLKGIDGPLTDLQHADIGVIHKSGYNLLGLIDNVITLSELESGTLKLQQQPIDLTELVRTVVHAAEQRLVDAAIEWQRQAPLPQTYGDAALLRQALLGLVTAVAEHMPGDRITVRTFVCDGDERWASIHVGNGTLRCSVVGDVLPSVDGDVEEMSVGLALARRIVQLHQGQLRLRFDARDGLDGVALLAVNGASV
jgi:signal transduction histidine kinase/HAMP domain-containing protein